MTTSTFIKSQPALTATIKTMMEQGGDCYTQLGNKAYIRLVPNQKFIVYRAGVAPAAPRGKRVWAAELNTFHKFAQEAGLNLGKDWEDEPVKPGFYGARCALAQPELLGVTP
jgi:hypothetical protein